MRMGVIELYSDINEALLARVKYRNIKERKRAMEIWSKRYASKFRHCYFIISPTVDVLKVKKNGENGKHYNDYENDSAVLANTPTIKRIPRISYPHMDKQDR